MEQWKNIKNYEDYQISNESRVKSLKHGKERMLKQIVNSDGYCYINLCKNGKQKYLKIHRLVAEAFIPNPENKPEINHIDGNKQNNRVDNLEYCTRSENIQHAHKNGLREGTRKRIVELNKQKSKAVNQYDKQGNFIKTWESMHDVERILNIDNASISRCCKGKVKTAGNYIWKYTDTQ